MSASLRAEIFGKLHSYHLNALAIVGSEHPTIQKNLEATGTRIARLAPDGDLGTMVQTGAWPHEKWAGYAKIQWEDVSSQLSYFSEARWDWPNVWNQIVLPTVKQVADKIPDKPEVFGFVGLLVAGLIAVAVIRVKG